MGELQVEIIKGAWLDAGTYDALLQANVVAKEKSLNKNFHPLVNEAIAQFNEELKEKAKSILKN